MRAAAWLSDEARVSESTIQSIVTLRTRYTELRVADKLVTALDKPWLLGDENEMPILPNPNAKPSVRAKCCSGSTVSPFPTFAASYELLALAV